MMKIESMVLGIYQTNCYIVYQEGAKECVVIDPGYKPEKVLARLEELGLKPVAILLTHGHFDHVSAVKELAAETDCKVFLQERDLSLPPKMTNGPLYYTDLYKEGDTLELAGLTIQVMETPGHTPGSICLLVGDALFSGDTLFAGSRGRTDLPGGDEQQIMASLARLAGIQKHYDVYPGHSIATTLEREQEYNPYMRASS